MGSGGAGATRNVHVGMFLDLKLNVDSYFYSEKNSMRHFYHEN